VPAALHVLSLNSGSSSLKFALYAFDEVETRLAAGAVESIGTADSRLWIAHAAQHRRDVPGKFPDTHAAVQAILQTLDAHGCPTPMAVGHRLVHGGPDHFEPECVDASLMATLRRLVPFAPLHLPAAIDGIDAVAAHLPGLPQVVCFDTAFHRHMPGVAQRLPLPRALWNEGIHRYGFHGLSYEYIVESVGPTTLGRAVIAHLGNGASLAAVRDGRSVDTTMGFTPAGGVMMGTRSGDVDPGVLLYLLATGRYDAAGLARLVNRESGLLGVSGISADMKTLLARRNDDSPAAQAIDMFCYDVRKHIGAFAAVLDGLDTIVFTGGIGERAAPIRAEICGGLAHLGIRLDAEQNAADQAVISTPESSCTVRVIPTDEDVMIARHTRDVLATVQD